LIEFYRTTAMFMIYSKYYWISYIIYFVLIFLVDVDVVIIYYKLRRT